MSRCEYSLKFIGAPSVRCILVAEHEHIARHYGLDAQGQWWRWGGILPDEKLPEDVDPRRDTMLRPLVYGLSDLRDPSPAPIGPAEEPLRRALETYTQRRGVYGPSERVFGNVMDGLFPNGLTLKGTDDWVRFGLFIQEISKLSRYARDFHTPHPDSMHDLGVYAHMLEAEDLRVLANAKEENQPL